MEYRVDIKGDTSGATRGAAALRDECAAARELAGALKDSQRELAALKSAREAITTGGQSVDVATYRSLSAEIEKAGARANELATALVKSGQAGRDFAGEEAANKEREKAGKDRAREEQEQRKAAQQARIEGLLRAQADVKGARETAAAVKDTTTQVLGYGAALAGIGSLGELTKMAAGWRVMGQLQMVSARATMDLRRDMVGVDAQPLVRAAVALEKNLSKSSTTGAALSGLLTRGFSGAFAAMEKLEPAIEATFQAAVLGGLMAEGAWLKVTTTLLPLTSALEDAASDVDAIGIAADLVTTAFQGVDKYVQTVASGIAFAADKAEKLNRALGGVPAQVLKKVPDVIGTVNRDAAALLTSPIEKGADALRGLAGDKGAGGSTVNTDAAKQAGKDIGDGLITGMGLVEAAVRAAGKSLGVGAVEGAREGADAHSPSRETTRLAHDMGDGAIIGFVDRRAAVADAAQQTLAPKIDGGKASAGGSAAATPSGPLSVTLTCVFPGITSGKAEDLQRAAMPLRDELRSALITLGLPIPGAP